ncbi:hypothetical protein SETIT_6G056200v2 [Setaria italica]|uniref:Knottin scorpion toxin-like domain-containing protein n=1 Tax=Setaria italica TaxID=4555 RepID=A0A368RIK0_SETIT|nr:hypothetical protein SETIT_6G056200v2 [Setaria italica]
MALLKNNNNIAIFLTAILAMAVLLSSPYLAQGDIDSLCFPSQEGKPCDIQACNQVCKVKGYPDHDARCGHPPPGKGGNGEYCCCSPQ